MDLIRQLENASHAEVTTHAKLMELAEAADVTIEVLTESIVAYLGNLVQLARQGQLLQSPKVNQERLPFILGAVDALTDPDVMAGMGLKPETAKTLLKIAFSNNPYADRVEGKLVQMGQQAAWGQTKKIQDIINSGDQQKLAQAVNQITNSAKKAVLIQQPPQPQPKKPEEDSWFIKQPAANNQQAQQPRQNIQQNEGVTGELGLLDIIKNPFDFTKL